MYSNCMKSSRQALKLIQFEECGARAQCEEAASKLFFSFKKICRVGLTHSVFQLPMNVQTKRKKQPIYLNVKKINRKETTVYIKNRAFLSFLFYQLESVLIVDRR